MERWMELGKDPQRLWIPGGKVPDTCGFVRILLPGACGNNMMGVVEADDPRHGGRATGKSASSERSLEAQPRGWKWRHRFDQAESFGARRIGRRHR